MLKNTINLFALLLLVIGLAACGGNESQTGGAGQDTSRAGGQGASGDVAEIVVEPNGNNIEYATKEFTVQAGQQVHLVFRNTASVPGMNHNVVILQSQDAIDRVGQAAMQAQDYIPQDDAILAYTPMSEPGQTVEVTFTAPEQPGQYPYICTFPGHYTLMQGQMIVQ